MEQQQIPELSLNALNDKESLKLMQNNNNINYYWSLDWSNEFYIQQAYEGFISVSLMHQNSIPILLPEMQFSYALLNWENIHIPKKIKKMTRSDLLNHYYIKITDNPLKCYNGICNQFKEKNWLSEHYLELLKGINDNDTKIDFELCCIELWKKKKLIAGEIGYTIGSTYTSLTGFVDQDKKLYNNMGKVQLLSLAQILIDCGYHYWNLGHPQLKYKIDLGAKEIERTDFLEIWNKHRDLLSTVRLSNYYEKKTSCNQLILKLINSF